MHLSKPTSTFTNNAAQTRRRGDQPQENRVETTLFTTPRITESEDTDARMSTFLPLGDQLNLRLVSRASKNAIDTGNPITRMKCLNSQTFVGNILSLATLPDGRVVTGSADRTAKIWDIETRTLGQDD